VRHDGLVELRTARLVLRQFRRDDPEEFARFATVDAYRRYLDEEHPGPTQFVENNVGNNGAWVIELDGVVVGSIFLGDELACLLDPAAHRRGIAVEAAVAVIRDGFSRRGYSEIDPRHRAGEDSGLALETGVGGHPGELSCRAFCGMPPRRGTPTGSPNRSRRRRRWHRPRFDLSQTSGQFRTRRPGADRDMDTPEHVQVVPPRSTARAWTRYGETPDQLSPLGCNGCDRRATARRTGLGGWHTRHRRDVARR
jgi:hypothetical protein